MEFLSSLNLEQLGAAGIIIGILLYQNWELKKDLREMTNYAREINKLFQESQIKVVESIKDLQQMLAVLTDRK